MRKYIIIIKDDGVEVERKTLFCLAKTLTENGRLRDQPIPDFPSPIPHEDQ